MEPSVDVDPVQDVLNDRNLVAEIMLLLASSKCMISCSGVSTTWLSARRNQSFASRFAATHKPAFLGFIVEFQQIADPWISVNRLMFPLPSSGAESAVALRPTVNLAMLAGDEVLGSRHGTLLTAGHEPGTIPSMYFTSLPTKTPRIYAAVGEVMPRLPVVQGQHSKNTFGQFGIIHPASPSKMSFFVKDARHYPFCTYAGVSFCSDDDIFVHVSVLTDGMWIRHVSHAIKSDGVALFHRNPYSVLVGDTLYMMYVVGYIVCFNLVSSSFSIVPLPEDVLEKTRSWYDYTVVRHNDGGLALVHQWHGMLYTWLLSTPGDAHIWKLSSTIDLMDIFVPPMPFQVWAGLFRTEAFPLGTDNFFSVQVRAASEDATFVLLTLGFDPGLYLVDMMEKTVRPMVRAAGDGQIGSIFALSEPWPPKLL